jgi:hypothetical protein
MLRMMGVTLSGHTFVYGDNMSVVHNTHMPESVLKKKSNSICYHAVRESAAMGDSIIGHVPSVDKPADICPKVVPGCLITPSLRGSLVLEVSLLNGQLNT